MCLGCKRGFLFTNGLFSVQQFTSELFDIRLLHWCSERSAFLQVLVRRMLRCVAMCVVKQPDVTYGVPQGHLQIGFSPARMRWILLQFWGKKSYFTSAITLPRAISRFRRKWNPCKALPPSPNFNPSLSPEKLIKTLCSSENIPIKYPKKKRVIAKILEI